jgi:hypothetical protein
MTTRYRPNCHTSRVRKRSDLTLSKVRSALTNGSKLFLGDTLETGPWCRRLRDLRLAYEADLGGGRNLSEGQRCIVHRLAMMHLQCDMLEARFAQNEGEASAFQLTLYQRTSNSMRRLIESLGLNHGRVAIDVTPTDDDLYAEVVAAANEASP